jgi:hypothetical protein
MSKAVKVALLLSFGAVLAFLVWLLLFDEPLDYWLDCNRFSGTCTFTQNLIARTRVGTARIDTLREAESRSGAHWKGKPRTSVWVVSDRGSYFFADYRARREAEEAAEKINAFLRDPTRGRLLITQSDRTMYWVAWGLVPVAAAFVVGLVSVLFSKKTPSAAGRES